MPAFVPAECIPNTTPAQSPECQVDRQFSLGNLEKALKLNQREALILRSGVTENRSHYSSTIPKQSRESSYQFKENSQDNSLGKA